MRFSTSLLENVFLPVLCVKKCLFVQYVYTLQHIPIVFAFSFVRSYVRLFVRSFFRSLVSVTFVEFTSEFLVKVSLSEFISLTTY